MVFKFDISVRWIDTDALGVVHYSNYFRYLRPKLHIFGALPVTYESYGLD